MEIVNTVAGRIADCLFDVPGRQLAYLYHYNDNIGALRKQAEKLSNLRERVQEKIDVAKRNGEIIETDAEKWIASVDKIIEEAKKFLEDEDEANKKCFRRWSFNIRSSYKYSKGAQQKTLAISEVQGEGQFESVSHPAPSAGIIPSSWQFSTTMGSRQSIMKEIVQALIDDSVSIIGICGMGGVGKTTLVKEISTRAKEFKLYDTVVMAVVSQTPSILKIQEEIANILGLKLYDKGEPAIARLLWERIKNEKRILIILDDVWRKIELDMIGIPSGNNHKDCKVILTSRSQEVCNQMDAQRTFVVGTLSEEESWVLFKELAGPDVDNSDINPIAREVAAKCGGLPIALLTVGRALKNKGKHVWIDAARQFKKSTPTHIEGMHENVFSTLEFSFNHLDEEAKTLFLLCCLFPDDFNIPIEVLVRYGIGLRLFKDVDTVEEARGRADAIVSTLTFSFLLMAGYKDGYVKMHDVVRDVAITIASKGKHIYMVKSGTGLRDWPRSDRFEEFTGISLMSNDIHKLPDGLECPRLQVLLLQRNSPLLFSDSSFQGMKDLKVLDMSYIPLSSLPPSLSLVDDLRTLFLIGCKLGDLSVIGMLRNLEILSLADSDIQEIPSYFNKLTRLRLFDLMNCRELRRISCGVLACLCELEELYMGQSSMHWDIESNARFIELNALSQLTSLHIRIPDASVLPNYMPFENLPSFTIAIGNEDDFKLFPCSRTLSLSHDMRIPLFDWVKNLVMRAESLLLFRVIGLQNIIIDLNNEGFSELKSLTLSQCMEIKFLLNTLEWTPHAAFRSLEQLMMYDNPNLVEICHGQLPDESFSEIKKLEVKGCGSMSNIVPSHLLQRLKSVETLLAANCEALVCVFDFEGLMIAKEETMFLSLLKELTLVSLPEMTHIWHGDTLFISLHNLKMIRLDHCVKLKKLFSPALQKTLVCLENMQISCCYDLEEIFCKTEEEHQEREIMLYKNDHTTTSPSLGNLTYISIDSCSSVINLFTPSIIKRLVQLKGLEVSGCTKMQEILTYEKGKNEATAERIVFPRLYYIQFVGLYSLTCFCPGGSTIEFPGLEKLTFSGCPKMKTFGYGVQLTPKLKKVQVETGDWRWLGDLNATVQQFFKEQEMKQKQGFAWLEDEPMPVSSET